MIFIMIKIPSLNYWYSFFDWIFLFIRPYLWFLNLEFSFFIAGCRLLFNTTDCLDFHFCPHQYNINKLNTVLNRVTKYVGNCWPFGQLLSLYQYLILFIRLTRLSPRIQANFECMFHITQISLVDASARVNSRTTKHHKPELNLNFSLSLTKIVKGENTVGENS